MDNRTKDKIKRKIAIIEENKILLAVFLVVSIIIGSLLNGYLLESAKMIFDINYKRKTFFQLIAIGLTKHVSTAIIFSLLILIFLSVLFLRNKGNLVSDNAGFDISERTDFGSAAWMPPEQQEKVFQISTLKHVTLPIVGTSEDGKLVYAYNPPARWHRNNHCVIVGQNGSGKSRGFSIPNIFQAIRRGESVICTDPKGELYSMTSEVAKAHGYTVKLINTITPQASDGCNFVAMVKGDILMARILVQVMMDNLRKDDTGFWNDVTKNLLEAIILYCDSGDDPNYERSMTGVYRMCTKSASVISMLFEALPENHPAKSAGMAFANNDDDKVKASAAFGLFTVLGIFGDPNVQKIISEDEMDLTLPGREKCIYYMCSSDQTSTLDVVQGMFFSFLFIYLVQYADRQKEKKLPVEVNFILDEFPNIAKIPDFKKKINTVRSRGINITILFQDYQGFIESYGESTTSIISAAAVFIFLGSTEPTTLAAVEEMLGVATADTTQTSHNRNTIIPEKPIHDFSEREGTSRRNLMNKDEIERMDEDMEGWIIIKVSGQKPIKLKRFDRTMHFMDKEIVQVQADEHIPKWRQLQDDALNVSSNYPVQKKNRRNEEFESSTSGDDEEKFKWMISQAQQNVDKIEKKKQKKVKKQEPDEAALNIDEAAYLPRRNSKTNISDF